MSTTPETPDILSLAQRFSAEEQESIAQKVHVAKDDAAFQRYLGMAQFYGLSPQLDEIWLIEGRDFDPKVGDWVDVLRPAVGRDGFLKIARRDENFKQVRGNVVCANDHFSFHDDGENVVIDHSATLTREDGEGGSEIAEVRGAVLGAWGKCFYRDDTPPFFYYAPISEYGKRGSVAADGAEPEEDWVGAWSYTSALILKCAQSYVLRLGVGITGLAPADEIRPGTADLSIAGASRQKEAVGGIEEIVNGLDIEQDTKDDLIQCLQAINELSPFSWATAKVSIVLDGADQAQAEKVVMQISEEIAKLDGGAFDLAALRESRA